MLVALVAIYTLSTIHSNNYLDAELEIIEHNFQSEFFHHSIILTDIAERVLQNPTIVKALANRDRQALLNLSRKLVQTFKNKNGITHVYFHDANRRNLTSLCSPEKWGDLLTRSTLMNTQKSDEIESGIALGDCGNLSLRVAAPVFDNNKLIGFLEIGENISRYTKHIQKLFNIKSFILIEKQRVIRAAYESKQAGNDKISQWDILPEQLIIFSERGELPPVVLQWMKNRTPFSKQHAHKLKILDKIFHVSSIPIKGSNGTALAEVIILNDMTEYWSSTYELMLLMFIGIIVVAILLFVMLNGFLIRLQKKMESEQKALVESEANLTEAQQIAHIGNWSHDLSSNKIKLSDEILRIFKINQDKSEVSYNDFLKNVHPDDRDRVIKAYTDTAKNKLAYDIEYRLLLADDSIKYISVHGKNFYDENELPIRRLGTVEDITLRKTAEIKQRNEDLRYKVLLDNLPQMVFMKDTESRYLLVNKQFSNALGLQPQDMLGKLDDEFYPPELAKKFQNNDGAVMDSGVITEFDQKFIKENGEEFTIHNVKIPILENTGNLLGIVGISWDITEQLAQQLRLEKQLGELLEFKRLTVGRELRMEELETEIQEMKQHIIDLSVDIKEEKND